MLLDKLLSVHAPPPPPPEVGDLLFVKTTPQLPSGIFDVSDCFGGAVSHNDTHVFCGTPNGGKLYAYNISTGALTYTIDCYNPNLGVNANFGFGWGGYTGIAGREGGSSIACTNTYLVMGSARFTQLGYTYSGVVHVFNAATGQLIFTLNNPNPVGTYAEDYFGHSVAVNDDYVVVGAPKEDWGASSGGAFYVFSLVNGALVYSKGSYNLTGSGGTSQYNDGAGYRVLCNSTLVAVSAPQEDFTWEGEVWSNAGVVYIYDIATGNHVRTIYNPDYLLMSTYFGSVMSMSESYLLVGCPNHTNGVDLNVGIAYLFDVNDGTLLRTFTNPDVNTVFHTDQFGYNVAVNEDYSVICNIQDYPYPLYEKYFDIYDNTTGFLVQRVEAVDRGFGNSCISITGSILCVGALYGTTGTGSMYVYSI